jgi:gamma-glutamyl-gamma-aminobutyraldehyde dehydrogenase
MGQNCSAGSRLIVHSSIKDKLLTKVSERIEKWKVGDPLDPETMIGPLVEQAHMEKVLGHIQRGLEETGGAYLDGGRVLESSGGYFVAPVIFDGVTNGMSIAQEEIFGPVLSVICFEAEEEAIQIANDSCYGLAASVWTEDLKTAHRLSRAIKAGTVTINVYGEGDNSTPFGGYKQSGFGGRDKSIFAHDQYTEMKTIWIDNS